MENIACWTIVASIASAASALFAAISAWLLFWQNKTRYKVKLYNELITDKPQNVFVSELHFAMIRIDFQNLSNHILHITDCSLSLDDKKYYALEQGTDYELAPSISLGTTYNAKKELNTDKNADGFIKFPLKLEPHQFISGFILIPDFPESKKNILECKLRLESIATRTKSAKVYLHPKNCTNS